MDFTSIRSDIGMGYVLWLMPIIPTAVFVGAWRVRHRLSEKNARPPQTEKLLCPPGYSLSCKVDELRDSIIMRLMLAGGALACGCALLSVVCAVVDVLILPITNWIFLPGIFAVGGVGALLTVSAFRGNLEAENMRLGMRGEQAVAEMLAELGEHGYRFFHDVPGDGDWNIDHVVVGPQGVFAIETKTRRKGPKKRFDQAHYKVVLEDHDSAFPMAKTPKRCCKPVPTRAGSLDI